MTDKALIDSKDEATEFCAIPGGRAATVYTLTELHEKPSGRAGDAHDAAYDVDATAKCFFASSSAGSSNATASRSAKAYTTKHRS